MDSTSFLLVVRVVASLGAVLGLLWFLQRRLGRTGGRRTANLITVLSRKGIGQRASVVVLDAEGRRFVLGVTDQSVTVLTVDDAPQPVIPEKIAGNGATPGTEGDKTEWQAATAGSILAPSTWRAAKEALTREKSTKMDTAA